MPRLSGGIGDPERTRGRKYHRSFSNTFDIAANSRNWLRLLCMYGSQSAGSTPTARPDSTGRGYRKGLEYNRPKALRASRWCSEESGWIGLSSLMTTQTNWRLCEIDRRRLCLCRHSPLKGAAEDSVRVREFQRAHSFHHSMLDALKIHAAHGANCEKLPKASPWCHLPSVSSASWQ
jgi:hypothetical protein